MFEKFKIFEKSVANLFDRPMKALCTDRGGEYVSGKMRKYKQTLGIRPEPTAPGTPEQNGVAEREN